jgi:hypothetical protein
MSTTPAADKSGVTSQPAPGGTPPPPQAPTPPGTPPPAGSGSRWGLLAFGVMIGILTALSTAAGTTVTLLGLLFALIGGSLLSWVNTTTIPREERAVLIGYAGQVATGVILGLFLGFALHWWDQTSLQPAIIREQNKAIAESLAGPVGQIEALLKRAQAMSQLSEADKKNLAESIELLNKNLVKREGKSVFETHGDPVNPQDLINDLRQDVKDQDLKLDPPQRASLTRLADTLQRVSKDLKDLPEQVKAVSAVKDKLRPQTGNDLQLVFPEKK